MRRIIAILSLAILVVSCSSGNDPVMEPDGDVVETDGDLSIDTEPDTDDAVTEQDTDPAEDGDIDIIDDVEDIDDVDDVDDADVQAETEPDVVTEEDSADQVETPDGDVTEADPEPELEPDPEPEPDVVDDVDDVDDVELVDTVDDVDDVDSDPDLVDTDPDPVDTDPDPVDTDPDVVDDADPEPELADPDPEPELEPELDPEPEIDTDEDVISNTDEYLVRAMMAGERTPENVFATISWSGGWPVETSMDSFIFCHWWNDGVWALAGDVNDWSPASMTRYGDVSCIELAIASPEGSRYKFVESVGNTWMADPWARSYEYDDNGEFSYVRPPTDTHRIDRWSHLDPYDDLEPRTLRVYVPAGAGPWPVLYMHDGQNLFNPNGIWGGWHMQDAVSTAGVPTLIVGIDNTSERLQEYTHVDDQREDIGLIVSKGIRYAQLVQEVIRPHIEAVYGSTGHDGVMGSSMGGLASLHIANLYPADFDFAGSLSGSLYWGRLELANPLMVELYTSVGVLPLVVYADSGGSDGGDGCSDGNSDGFPVDDPNDSDSYCATRHFVDSLATMGYVWDTNLFHWHEYQAEHNEAAWAARVYRPLSIFLWSGGYLDAPLP